jgi:enoyl-CoA hydratase/carnithine racemase
MTEPTATAGPVLYEVAEGVATITLNRPDRLNAWNRAMAAGFHDALTLARKDPAVRVVVLMGAGRGFCSGADFDLLDEAAVDDHFAELNGPVLPTMLIDLPKPTIAAINGPAAGYGLVLALACDIRFAAVGAKLTSIFPRLGLIAEYGVSWLLPRLVGTATSLDVLLSGRVILGDEAERIGLVNRALEPDDLLRHTLEYARELATNSPAAMRTIKQQIYAGFHQSLSDSVQDSLRLMEESLRANDFKEALAAMAEKRKPRFSSESTEHPRSPTST